MFTLDPFGAVVHHNDVTNLADSQADMVFPDGGNSSIFLIAIVCAVILLTAALKQLGRAIAPIGELVRLVLSALAVAVLLIGAIALLVGALVVSVRGR